MSGIHVRLVDRNGVAVAGEIDVFVHDYSKEMTVAHDPTETADPLTVLKEFVEDTLDDLDPESRCEVTVSKQVDRVLIIVKPTGSAARIIGKHGVNINAVRTIAAAIGGRLLQLPVTIDVDAPRVAAPASEPSDRPRYVDPRRAGRARG